MDFKRILLFIGFFLAIGGIAFALYFFFFRAAPAPVVTPPGGVTTGGTGGGLPTAGEGTGGGVTPTPTQPPVIGTGAATIADGGITQVTAVTPAPTAGASVSKDGSLSYYNRNDGRFYRIGSDGTPTQLSDKQFANVSNAVFSPTGTNAILEYPDGSNVSYDFATNRQVTLPKHWEEFDFSASGDQIVAKSIGVDESNRFLVVANPDGSGARAVQELGDKADKVTVAYSPSGQSIAISETGRASGPTTHEVYFVGKNSENLRSMTIEGLNFVPEWSPSGKQLLYSTASAGNEYKPTLWIVDAYGDDIGRNRKSLSVSTWADKCTFADADALYCAVPRTLPRGAGLEPTLFDQVPDDIFRIDIATGLQTRVAIPEGDHTVDEIMLTPDKNNLYFTDKTTGVLNQIKLK
jgi:hypothetical protein